MANGMWRGLGFVLPLWVLGAAAAAELGSAGNATAAPPPPPVQQPVPAPPAAPLTEQLLATLPEDRRIWGLQFDPALARVAWIEEAGRQERLVCGGRRGPAFDTVDYSYVLGTARERVAYAAQVGGQWFPVVDHEPGEAYERVQPPVCTRDGARVAFVVRHEGRWFVRLDRRLHGPYDAVHGLVFSAGGQAAAWIATQGEEQVVVREGRPVPAMRGRRCWNLAISHDGTKVACLRQSRTTTLGVNGRLVMWPRKAQAVAFAPAGPGAYTVARPDRRVFLRRDRDIGPVHDAVFDVVFSADGSAYAYRAVSGDLMRIVWNTRQGRRYRDVSTPVLSADGAHVGYRATGRSGHRLVVDGQESEPFEHVARHVRFGPDGRTVAFGIRRGRECRRLVRRLPLTPPGSAGEGEGK